MRREGRIALVAFPFTDQLGSRQRPVLILRRASTRFDDWLACMVSSQLRQADPHLDEILAPGDPDFPATGLKAASVLRLSRLAVIDGALFTGSIGAIPDERLDHLRRRLAAWLIEAPRAM